MPTAAFLRALLVGGSPPPPPLPTVLLKDLFIGADNTHLEDHVMNVGPGWTQSGSQDFRIFSDSASDRFGDDGPCLSDAGVAIGSVSATLSTGTGVVFGGLAFNGVLGAASCSFILDLAGQQIHLFDSTQGDVADASYNLEADTTYALRVEITADAVTCYIDDVGVLSTDAGNIDQRDGTCYGLYGFAGAFGEVSVFNAFMFLG